jgi:hypothetical protein
MQGLFAMFPAGRVGVALLGLRMSVAVICVMGASRVTPGFALALVLPAASLCLGFASPLCATLCTLAEIAFPIASPGTDTAYVLFAALVTGVSAVLGPGAYSIDARLFGRRSVTFDDETH